jgi:cyclohexyl-isocyanide hydratase
MSTEARNAHDGPAAGERQLQVGMLLFTGATNLDFVGPHLTFVSAGMKVHLVSDTLAPIVTDTGMEVLPTATMADCPADLDILFVPGGSVDDVLTDRARLDFLAERAATASYITSVCTGALVLAAAGLLDGYRAATHWSAHDHLARLGIEVSTERVCADRNRFTGGGVTAGIDFGLTLVAHILGDEVARFAQLAMEYDPQPPFDAGSPGKAGASAVSRFREVFSASDRGLTEAVSRVLERRSAVIS